MGKRRLAVAASEADRFYAEDEKARSVLQLLRSATTWTRSQTLLSDAREQPENCPSSSWRGRTSGLSGVPPSLSCVQSRNRTPENKQNNGLKDPDKLGLGRSHRN